MGFEQLRVFEAGASGTVFIDQLAGSGPNSFTSSDHSAKKNHSSLELLVEARKKIAMLTLIQCG
jgi:hypothetical protein